MKDVIEMNTGAKIYTPSLSSGVQKLIGGDTQTHRQHYHNIILLYFFKIRKVG
jgi:hypothetical protein